MAWLGGNNSSALFDSHGTVLHTCWAITSVLDQDQHRDVVPPADPPCQSKKHDLVIDLQGTLPKANERSHNSKFATIRAATSHMHVLKPHTK